MARWDQRQKPPPPERSDGLVLSYVTRPHLHEPDSASRKYLSSSDTRKGFSITLRTRTIPDPARAP